jgi:hypothetical protein
VPVQLREPVHSILACDRHPTGMDGQMDGQIELSGPGGASDMATLRLMASGFR